MYKFTLEVYDRVSDEVIVKYGYFETYDDAYEYYFNSGHDLYTTNFKIVSSKI